MRSKYTKRRKQKEQGGGLRVTNIITEENKHNYVGRLVRVVSLPWMPRDLLDENNIFYVRDTLHNIGPEYFEGEIWDNSFVKAGTIIEMTEEEEEDHYQNMHTPRNYGLLNVVYRDDRPGFDDYINLLYRIPLSLDQLNSELDFNSFYQLRDEDNRLNYLIELITPERDILSRRNIIERTAQRRQHRLDRGAFKEFATSRKLRDFPPDIKEHILSSMNVEPSYDRRTFPQKEYLDAQSMRNLFA
tara:strand:- start:1016 stop:1747 length:732 start_codon:yes stop_codon:yes gene_type:complete